MKGVAVTGMAILCAMMIVSGAEARGRLNTAACKKPVDLEKEMAGESRYVTVLMDCVIDTHGRQKCETFKETPAGSKFPSVVKRELECWHVDLSRKESHRHRYTWVWEGDLEQRLDALVPALQPILRRHLNF